MVFAGKLAFFVATTAISHRSTNSFDFGFDVGPTFAENSWHIHDAESIHDSFPTKGLDSNKIDGTTTLQEKQALAESLWSSHDFAPCGIHFCLDHGAIMKVPTFRRYFLRSLFNSEYQPKAHIARKKFGRIVSNVLCL